MVIDAGETNWRLLADDTTDESVWWQFRMPSFSGTLTIEVQYSMASATSGNVVLTAAVMAVTPGDSADINTESYDTANSATDAVPGTAGYLGTATITLTNNDSVAAGDLVKILLSRDANNGSDTASGDCEIVSVTLVESE